MKVCIIGKGSYIGNHIDNWLSHRNIDVFQLDVLTEDWRNFDFTPYDAIVHVAGIVHRPDCQDQNLYKRVNTDMPINIAWRYKSSKAQKKTFVFLSTMAVFGVSKRLNKNVITAGTPTAPQGLYAQSKKAAEEGLLPLQSDDFNVVIVRPPNVYGKNCRGGYISGFAKVAKTLPFIPKAYTSVKQSVLYIDNLCELVYQLIKGDRYGIFMPQDDKAVSAIEIVKAIGAGLDINVRTCRILGVAAHIGSFLPIIQKAYGGVEYSQELSDFAGISYRVVPFEEAIKLTVK